jgi:hypothetical protein
MLRLRGKPLGGAGAIAFGSATVLRAPNDIPMLPARLVAQMARTRRDEPIEPVEIVVVARDYDAASSLALPWARVVGIVVEYAREDADRPAVPAVSGIESVLEKIDDDALLLIDGERGIVLVDPDGTALAAYQAERERIAPRRRIFLDYSHQPAVSLDGREVRVLARVTSLEEVREALDNGADTLYVDSGPPLLGPDDDDSAHLETLLNLAEAAGGKPLTIAWDVQTVTAANILQAARRAEVTVAVPLSGGTEGLSEVQHYLQDTREELLEEDIDFADVRIAGAVEPGEVAPDELADLFVSRIIVAGRLGDTPGDEWLENLTRRATMLLLPVEVDARTASPDATLRMLALGAAGVIVAPADVSAVKERIRETNLTRLRHSILVGAAGVAGETASEDGS